MDKEKQTGTITGISGTKPGDAPNISRRDELNPKPPTNRDFGKLGLTDAIQDHYRQQRR